MGAVIVLYTIQGCVSRLIIDNLDHINAKA
jgi:hypothetical protein